MDIERVELVPGWIVGLREVLPATELKTFFGPAFATVAKSIGAQGIRPVGPPSALYRAEPSDKIDVTVGFPVAGPVRPDGDLVCEPLPHGPAVTTVYTGPYEALERVFGELTGWMVGQGLTAGPVMWEEYLVGPADEADPARWRTRIVFPLS
jgi:effector-binding domain-containing protein